MIPLLPDLINIEGNCILESSEYHELYVDRFEDLTHKQLNVLHLNIHGTISKLSALKSYVKELQSSNRKPGVILLCKTS